MELGGDIYRGPFDWFRNKNIKNKSIPITEPWVGFMLSIPQHAKLA